MFYKEYLIKIYKYLGMLYEAPVVLKLMVGLVDIYLKDLIKIIIKLKIIKINQ
jgi:hypothetical protein